MKKGFVLILVTLLVMAAMPVIAEEKPATQLEQFTAKKGEILVKEFYDIGGILGEYGASMEITALVLYEPGATKRLYGLKIYIEESGDYPDQNTSFLDFEELISLSKALSYMIELSEKWALMEKEYTEVLFQTEGDYQIGFFQNGLAQSAFSESGRIGSASIFLGIIDLKIVKALIDKGIAKLESLGAE